MCIAGAQASAFINLDLYSNFVEKVILNGALANLFCVGEKQDKAHVRNRLSMQDTGTGDTGEVLLFLHMFV